METLPYLSALIVASLVAAAIVWLVPGPVRRHVRSLGVIFGVVIFALAVVMALSFDASAPGTTFQFYELHAWIPQFGVSYALGINGVGLTMILLATLLVPIVLLAARKEQEDDKRAANYTALILLLEAFMIAVFAARDAFLFYVLFEAMLIPVYFLIGAFGGPNRRGAAVKFLLYSLFGGLIMLVALIVLYAHSAGGDQAFLIENLMGAKMSLTVERLTFLGFFVAFAIKAPMFPVHTWLPDAASQAKPGTSVLLVGVLDKVGTFGMLTLCLPLFPRAVAWAAPVIIVLAIISVLYGALLAIGQKDIFRMIAYTSVSHFGFIVLGIFAFTQTAEVGSSFYMVNHGLSTGALFLLAGFLVQRGGTADMDEYAGLQKVTPLLAGTFLVTGLSAIALPGMSTFVSEFLVLAGTFQVNKAAAIIAGLGVILAALYILLAYQKIFTGPVRSGLEKVADLKPFEVVAVIVPIIMMLVLGFYPAPALDVLRPAAHTAVEQVPDAPQPEAPALPKLASLPAPAAPGVLSGAAVTALVAPAASEGGAK